MFIWCSTPTQQYFTCLHTHLWGSFFSFTFPAERRRGGDDAEHVRQPQLRPDPEAADHVHP
jgi:hypothetical protein